MATPSPSMPPGKLFFRWPASGRRSPWHDSTAEPICAVDLSPEQEIYEALVLGVRDYFSKCGFKSAVLGLSGGIDSAVTAVLAVAALGKENVVGVSMPSQYSSQGSLDDAAGLAKNLGIVRHVVSIKEPFDVLKNQFKEIFVGQSEDTTEENMQSRLRGLTLMSMSNKFGHLLLTTGNKSELAVGYCTIYGDMCGGLAVISDVPKTMIYQLAHWINRETEIIPNDSIRKASKRRVKAGSEGSGYVAAVRSIGRDPENVRGRAIESRGDCRPRFRSGNRSLDSAKGGYERIQKAPGSTRS